MFRFLTLCFGTLVRLFRSRHSLLLENLALRQQLVVLKRRHPRPKLDLFDKLFWLVVRRCWSGWKQAVLVAVVKDRFRNAEQRDTKQTQTLGRDFSPRLQLPIRTPMFGGEDPRLTSGVSGELLLHGEAIQNGPVLNIWMSRMRQEHHGLNTAKSLSFGFRLRASSGKSCSR